MNTFSFESIGIISTSFKEKFGLPRQSNMAPNSKAILKFHKGHNYKQALKEIEGFSHLWILFVFNRHLNKKWKPLIEPPRLDAPSLVGVFASRSPNRPNAIGISAVKLDSVVYINDEVELHLSNVDFLDETPVLDVKPYLPYADSYPNAIAGWASKEIPSFPVHYKEEFIKKLKELNLIEQNPNYLALLTDLLKWDPRPKSQKKLYPMTAATSNNRTFQFKFLDFDIKWQIFNSEIFVIDLN